MKRLIGQIATKIDQDDETITMTFKSGMKAHFYHEQECCERVDIEDVNGDWDDLVGSPLLVAEEREADLPAVDPETVESFTWTLYTFRTLKGSVDVRWYSTSNGYYSESVDLKITYG